VTAVRVMRVAALVAAGVLALACDVAVEITADEPGTEATTTGRITEPEPAPEPEPDPAMRPELLIIEPAEASAGELLALLFPEETMRGIAFHLDRSDGDGWTTTYLMTSDGNGSEPATVPVGTEGYGWEDVGVGGLGPDHVRLPGDATTGSYRVCTANALDDFCAPLEIAR